MSKMNLTNIFEDTQDTIKKLLEKNNYFEINLTIDEDKVDRDIRDVAYVYEPMIKNVYLGQNNQVYVDGTIDIPFNYPNNVNPKKIHKTSLKILFIELNVTGIDKYVTKEVELFGNFIKRVVFDHIMNPNDNKLPNRRYVIRDDKISIDNNWIPISNYISDVNFNIEPNSIECTTLSDTSRKYISAGNNSEVTITLQNPSGKLMEEIYEALNMKSPTKLGYLSSLV